jgi:hypothetical protein
MVVEPWNSRVRSPPLSAAEPERSQSSPELGPFLWPFSSIWKRAPVALTFPASLSTDSYQDLSDYPSLFLRKAKRHADAIRQFDEMVGKTGDE